MTSKEMEVEVVKKLSEFSNPHKKFAKRLHEIILASAPELCPRLWYGMPGYAKTKDSAVICFFREDKYMTFGLTESVSFAPEKNAKDQLMPCAWFFTDLDAATEKSITTIVKNAMKN